MKMPFGLPAPTTFAEGMRLVFGCLAAFAGIFCGAMAVAMIALLMWGRWSKGEEHTIVVIFGYSLGGFIIAMCIVILGLLVGGPVGRFKAGASLKDGVSLESESTESARSVTATATVTTEPKPPGGKDAGSTRLP